MQKEQPRCSVCKNWIRRLRGRADYLAIWMNSTAVGRIFWRLRYFQQKRLFVLWMMVQLGHYFSQFPKFLVFYMPLPISGFVDAQASRGSDCLPQFDPCFLHVARTENSNSFRIIMLFWKTWHGAVARGYPDVLGAVFFLQILSFLTPARGFPEDSTLQFWAFRNLRA